MSSRQNWKTYAYWGVLWLVALVYFFPVLWIILSAFKTKEDLLSIPPKWLFQPTLANFASLFNRESFWPTFCNSLLISVVSVSVAIVISFLAAYALSRFKPFGTDFIMFLILSIRMVPGAAVVVPVYLMYAALGWKDGFWPMTLFYAMYSIPFSLWILKGFMGGVSLRFDETGLANNASRFHVIFKVILPQVKPGLIAAFVFNLIFVWNEFLFNFILGGKSTTTIPTLLVTQSYQQGGVDWTFVASLGAIYLLPPVIALYFFQKYLLVGMTFGAVRGEV
ncbi:MAG: carbohydrate ABC transporter permease [Verrucomicrobia bacterium]|nr:carbohydrate ABC transporter permease [Verrucomicrobiota bacterium]